MGQVQFQQLSQSPIIVENVVGYFGEHIFRADRGRCAGQIGSVR